ncbi:MAG: hypothetical protein JXR73_13055 [Candidatus Omnitrophica bacterium]|nr:hypothetical protein [Candidatus Omnitrophota bacterium]
MNERVEVFLVDEEGILLRSHIESDCFFFDGNLEDPESPLMIALREFYIKDAPKTLMSMGFETPAGIMFWQSEMASPFGDDEHIEVGERLFLTDESGQRFFDELAYDILARGRIPVGWELIAR